MFNSPPQVNGGDGVGVVVGGVVGGAVGGRAGGGVVRGGLVDGVSVVVGGAVGTLIDWNVHLNPLWLELWVGPAWKMARARLEDIVIEPGFVH